MIVKVYYWFICACNVIIATLFIEGIVVEAYSPLGNPGSPFLGGKKPKVLDDPIIKEIAQKNGASIAQVTKSRSTCSQVHSQLFNAAHVL